MKTKSKPAPVIDLVDSRNQPTYANSTINKACNTGLWHRGVTVIIYKPDGALLVQRRSRSILRNPGRYEFGAGGFIDSGESPTEAATREVFEETNIRLKESDLRPVGVFESISRWQQDDINKLSRSFIYCYIAPIDSNADYTPQESEAESIKFIPIKDVKLALKDRNSHLSRQLSEPFGFFSNMTLEAIKKIESQIKL